MLGEITYRKGIDRIKHSAGFGIHLLVNAKKLAEIGWLDFLLYFMLRSRRADLDSMMGDNEEGVYLVPDFGR